MVDTPDQVPDDKDALKAALIDARARLSGAEAMIEHLQLVIAKMKREIFGTRYGNHGDAGRTCGSDARAIRQ
jgi:hypothetical protein